MLSKGTAIFLQFPNEGSRRILHSGKIVECHDGVTAAAVFEEEKLPISAGLDLTLFYEWQRKFVQQPARIDAILEATAQQGGDAEVVLGTPDDPRPWGIKAALTASGEPVSAESRQCYRVSTAISERYAEIEGEKCKLMDVSATGYAVMTKKKFEVGSILGGAVTVDGRQFSGLISIQNARDLGSGRFRYGLYCADPKISKGNLKDGLPQLSMAIQREQLKRRSGAA